MRKYDMTKDEYGVISIGMDMKHKGKFFKQCGGKVAMDDSCDITENDGYYEAGEVRVVIKGGYLYVKNVADGQTGAPVWKIPVELITKDE